MTFKTVLNIVGHEQGDGDIKLAMDLCESADAHLSLLVMGIAAPPPIGDYASVISDAWLEERQADMERLGERAEEIEALVALRGVSADLSSEYVETAAADDVVGLRARYCDVAVMGPDLLATHHLKYRVANGVLFHAQRPLLLMSAGVPVTLSPKRIVIGWNSTLESARAVREALDMIDDADDVRVVLVDPKTSDRANGPEPGADIAAYLARHGAKVKFERLPSGGEMAGLILMQHARDVSADMLVLGAYGHSRLRQRMFGGVTSTMLDAPELPTFLAR
jgi:nucleotide-binding universal stress UspA family protein